MKLKSLVMSLVVKEIRDKVTLKIKRLNDEIKKKNDEARAAKVQADNDLIRHKREERYAWFLQSVKRMEGSALAIDQHATELERVARSDENDRRNLIRNKRNLILDGPVKLKGQTTLTKISSLFTNSSTSSDYVDPQKVTESLSLQHKQTTDSLQLLQVEQRRIKQMLQREFQEIILLFPTAVSMASSPLIKQEPFQLQSGNQTTSSRSASAFRSQSRSRFRSRQQLRSKSDTKLSTRFDSASVPLRLVRPQLPAIIKEDRPS